MKNNNHKITFKYEHILCSIILAFIFYRLYKYFGSEYFVIWFDSAQYAAVSLASLWSKEFWNDGIPPLYPFYLKYFHHYNVGSTLTELSFFSIFSYQPEIIKGIEIMPDAPYLVVKNNFNVIAASMIQSGISITAWIIFAVSFSKKFEKTHIKIVCIILILLLGSESSVVLWDKHILTEAMAISFLLLSFSMILYLPEHINKNIIIILFSLVLLLISLIKITNNYFIILLLPFIGFYYWKSGFKHTLRYSIIFTVILSLFILNQFMLFKGDRTHVPMKDLISSRISTEGYEDIYAYFRSEGMPEIEQELIARLWTAPFEKYPELHNWWLTKSSKTYQKFLITHPSYFFFRPFQYKNQYNKPVYHFFTPDIHHYEKVVPDKLQLIFTDYFLWLITIILVVLALIILKKKFSIGLDNIYLPLFILSSTLILYLIIWHADIGELDRHLIQCALMLRISLIMLLISLLDSVYKNINPI